MSSEPLSPVLSIAGTMIWFAVLAWATWYYSRWMARIRTGEDKVQANLFGSVEFGIAAGLSVFLAVMAIAGGDPEKASQMTSRDLIYNAGFDGVVVLIVVGLLALRKIPLREHFGLHWAALSRSGRAVLFFLAASQLVACVAVLMLAILGDKASPQEPVEYLVQVAKSGDHKALIVAILFSVVVAPIAEETLFRGFLYPAIKRYCGLLPSMAFTSVLFALIHTNVTALAPLTVLAMALVVAYEATGTIVTSILMHAAFNGANVAFMLWALHHAPKLLQ